VLWLTFAPSPIAASEDIWAHRGGAPAYRSPTFLSKVKLQFGQLVANALSSTFLIIVIIWALSVRFISSVPVVLGLASRRPKEVLKEWDDPPRWKKEKLVKDLSYYAQSCGFDIINETVETADGYLLRLHRVVDPQNQGKKHSDGRGESEKACDAWQRC
jgi:lysosomal acid lipase/cholesteryl ester hydrolase